MNEDIMRLAGLGKQVDRVKAGNCPICAVKVLEGSFRDTLSQEEYMISGLCQKCQDEAFGGE